MAVLVPVPALDIRTAIERFVVGQVMPVQRAHDKLSMWRGNHTAPPGLDPRFPPHMRGYTREYEDITDGDWDWRGYVCNRVPAALKEVVGQGVQRTATTTIMTMTFFLFGGRQQRRS